MRDIKYIVIHRIKVSHVGYADTPSGVRRFFAEHRDGIKSTGGRYPYHYTIDCSGEIHETEDIACSTPHAGKRNGDSIGLAVIGDFREGQPRWQQVIAAIYTCAELLKQFPRAKIVGHSDLDGASSDPNKNCPGSGLSVRMISTAADFIRKQT